MRAPTLLVALFAASVSAAAQAPAPVLFRGGRTDVVLDLPQLRSAAETGKGLAALVVSCGGAFTLTAGDSAAFVNATLPAIELAPEVAATSFTLSLVATDGLQPGCGRESDLAKLALSRGWRVTSDTTAPPDRSIAAATVSRQGRAIEPLSVQRLPLRRVGPHGLRSDGLAWLHIVLPLDAVAYQGVADSGFVIEVQTGGATDRVEVPESVVRALMRATLPVRAASLQDRAGGAYVAQPVSDPRVRAAQEEYSRGALRDAARRSATLLVDGTRLSRSDELQTRVLAGFAFLEGGDSVAAFSVLADLVEAEPCFTFHESAPQVARRAVAAFPRLRVRCAAVAPLPTLLRSAAMPGFGRPWDSDRLFARSLVAAAVISTAVVGYTGNQRAKEQYRDYVAWQYSVGAPARDYADALYGRAESTRQAAKSMFMASAAVYVGQGLWAVWAERRFARQVEAVQGIGRPERRVTVLPLWRAGQAGAAFSVAW